MSKTYDELILEFYKNLRITARLPKGVGVLNPFLDDAAFAGCQTFYKKYYHDRQPRKIILGINPGRLGSGLTGIPFTDSIRLATRCGITNDFPKKAELSSEFIYQVIAAFGGEEKFYRTFYFSSVSPLGFVKEGKNLNYYDLPALQKAIEPFALETLMTQMQWGLQRTVAFCLGEGDNYRYLTKLNARHHFFDRLIPLPHPRFIMQYRRKQLKHYIDLYLKNLALTE